MHPSHSILDYWFGTIPLNEAPSPGREDWWFAGDPTIDKEIANCFGSDIRPAANGSRRDWEAKPDSCLALLVLLDQFPRSIWRDDARSYEHDPHALQIARRAVKAGHDAHAHCVKRIFFYLPFMHSESMADQDRCVELITDLRDTSPLPCRETLTINLDFALKHRAVIEKFGRFPSRNKALGRDTTPEETAFMLEHGPGW